MQKIKVVLVDDHQMLLDGIKALLIFEKEFDIVAELTNGEDVLEILRNNTIDIVITDINMPGMDGLTLTKKIKEEFPSIKILALSMFGEHHTITEMINAGVSGYVLKNTGKQELIFALQRIAAGNLFFSDEITMKLQKGPHKLPESTNVLTSREKEILKLITKEFNNEKIAETLFISERTVETHRKNIFRKTNTKSIVGLIKYAFEKGMVEKS